MPETFSDEHRGEGPSVESDPSPIEPDAPLTNLSTEADAQSLAETPGAPLGLKIHLAVHGSDYIFEGVMEHFFGNEASILLDHRFQKETRVKVEFHGFQFDGEVLYCQRKGDRFDTHVVLADQDETGVRRDPRYVVNLEGRLYAPGTGDTIDAKLVDISREGIGVECASTLTVGDAVAVESQLNLVFGVVRHCRQTPTGIYRAGLQVHGAITKEEIMPERPKAQSQPKKQHSWMRGILPLL